MILARSLCERRIARDADIVARAVFFAVRKIKSAVLRGVIVPPDRPADLLSSLSDDLESVAVMYGKIRTNKDVSAARVSFSDRADPLADVPLDIGRDQAAILSEQVTAGVIAAVKSAPQGGKVVGKAIMAAVQEIAIIADGSRDVRRRAHAPFDLAGGDTGARKRRDILPHAQVSQGEAICRRVKSLAVDGIFLSARLLAKAAVAAVSADHGGKIALPGKTGTQRALDEAFRLDLFRDARNVRKRKRLVRIYPAPEIVYRNF